MASNREKCWNTMPTPSRRAARGSGIVTARPSHRISPASGWSTPSMIFTRVDLPAPFSPINPWISPGRTTRLTASFATTPGKRLVMPRKDRRGAGAGAP
jgi:hypothetical protein